MKPAEKRRARQEEEGKRRSAATLVAHSPEHHRYIRSIKQMPVTIAVGPAGTAKTITPAFIAAQMLDIDALEKVAIVRPAVEACGEKHGYLPGDGNKKLAPWAAPVVNHMIKVLGSREKADLLIKLGRIVTHPFTYMRGLDFTDTFVIFDEAQNATLDQIRLLVTRLGEGSKLVITGDISGGQNDLGPASGLRPFIQMVAQDEELREMVNLIEFTSDHVVRSPLVKAFVKAFERRDMNRSGPVVPLAA